MTLDETTTRRNDRASVSVDGLFPLGEVDGLYARTGLYERVQAGLNKLIDGCRPGGAEVFTFPPVMSRAQLERQGYLKSFPNLLGVVSCFCGDERHIRKTVERIEVGGNWTESLVASDLVLSPAACYPVYPMVAAHGPVPKEGRIFDVACDCFRREPSKAVDRLQSFRMREFVQIGSPLQVRRFRSDWMSQAQAIAVRLKIPAEVELATDPFFGRAGALAAESQMAQALKFELLMPVRSRQCTTACMSFNYHQDHFGRAWDIRQAGGEFAHSACVAFGLDRLTIALFVTHGPNIETWPPAVRSALDL